MAMRLCIRLPVACPGTASSRGAREQPRQHSVPARHHDGGPYHRIRPIRRPALISAHSSASPSPEDDSSLSPFGTQSFDVGVLSGGGAALDGGKVSGGDMLRLFQDAQDNMLFLNKQRLIAIEELQKVERDREFLMAKVAQLEAENNASIALRENLEQRLKATEGSLEIAQSRGSVVPVGLKGKGSRRASDPPSVWSSLLLRLDSMLLSGVVTFDQATALRRLVTARDVRAAELFEDLREESDAELSGPLLKLTQGSDRNLHVVHIASELAPVASTGALGSWVLGACRALRRKGHLVEVVLPLYVSMDRNHVDDLREHPGELNSFFEDSWHRNKIWTGTVYGVPVTFIQPLHSAGFFERDRLYGHEDDFERFTYFSRAALEYMAKVGKRPDVIHLHDWQTAIVAPLFWDIYHHQGIPDARLMLTCHDVHYQNPQPASKLSKIGLDPNQLNRPDRFQDPRDQSCVNLLKGGIVYTNKVTTVSPRYAADVKTPEFGCFLEGTFQAQSHKFLGLPSGLDDSRWDPMTDQALPVPISVEDDFTAAKAVARSELRKKLGLPLIDENTGANRTLVVCIAPFVAEHECEMLKLALNCTLQSHAQFVFVGASRSPKVQVGLEDLQREVEDPNAKFMIHFEESFAHLAVAAAQILFCFTHRDPTFEYTLAGLKYGAIPVSRQPLEGAQSLIDVDDPMKGAHEGVGYFLNVENAHEMTTSLSRAIKRAQEDPAGWEAITRRAMSRDTSWDALASEAYVDAYWSIYRC